jgi:hypothetical protein
MPSSSPCRHAAASDEGQSTRSDPQSCRSHRISGISEVVRASALLLGFVVAASASAQSLPPPSRTVFKCQQGDKVVCSDAPCLGAERLVVEPTRGLDSQTGRPRVGDDVRRERSNEQITEALRPIFGEKPEERAVRLRRARLPAAVQADCQRLDRDIPVAEAAERQAQGDALSRIQPRLLNLRRQYRSSGC